MINEFTIGGEIITITKDRVILLKNNEKNYITILCSPKLEIEKDYKGKIVEVSGYLTKTNMVELVATKIIERD